MSTDDTEFTGSPLHVPMLHITTHNASGQAIIHSTQKPIAKLYPKHRFTATTLYSTSTMPANLNADADLDAHTTLLKNVNTPIVQPNGTILRFADFAPNSHGFMHRTQSLDYGVVLEGTVVLELDDGSTTTMTKGDTAVQRATKHAWHNPSGTEWARVLFVLQDCAPLVVEGKVVGDDLGSARGALSARGKD
ncbi:hypothetical protein M409DRAFT_63741 [Zasmidium cellare ATCC 36951]|uniref:Cupin type-2 domain-containing protein n=1 Tax=Zasmidium cellare ATCC 36951 TaxID=1080233 RepID=A0A6A6CWU3_ZASCE|nr:uncharacterized protein M409DRAFT_63741 [Zasmidium cellare ATCC 36951]KAF2171495.1 hypothetical protein M409DRAFT_63741 [Zasmidium cellare ATCC 36951]